MFKKPNGTTACYWGQNFIVVFTDFNYFKCINYSSIVLYIIINCMLCFLYETFLGTAHFLKTCNFWRRFENCFVAEVLVHLSFDFHKVSLVDMIE